MVSVSKLKCPKCGKQTLKKVMAATKGKCSSCGYTIMNSITAFFPKPRTTMDIIDSFSV